MDCDVLDRLKSTVDGGEDTAPLPPALYAAAGIEPLEAWWVLPLGGMAVEPVGEEHEVCWTGDSCSGNSALVSTYRVPLPSGSMAAMLSAEPPAGWHEEPVQRAPSLEDVRKKVEAQLSHEGLSGTA